MAAVIHCYYSIVSSSLVYWLMCILEAVVQKELWPCLHYQYFASVIPNIDMKLAGCGVLMGVVVHLRKITFEGPDFAWRDHVSQDFQHQKMLGAVYSSITLMIKWETRVC